MRPNIILKTLQNVTIKYFKKLSFIVTFLRVLGRFFRAHFCPIESRPRHVGCRGPHRTCGDKEWMTILSTDIPAYSDTLGTRVKCHCNQIVTVSRGFLGTNQSFGTCQKCHYKRDVTINGVTVSGDICTDFPLTVTPRLLYTFGMSQTMGLFLHCP